MRAYHELKLCNWIEHLRLIFVLEYQNNRLSVLSVNLWLSSGCKESIRWISCWHHENDHKHLAKLATFALTLAFQLPPVKMNTAHFHFWQPSYRTKPEKSMRHSYPVSAVFILYCTNLVENEQDSLAEWYRSVAHSFLSRMNSLRANKQLAKMRIPIQEWHTFAVLIQNAILFQTFDGLMHISFPIQWHS